MSKKYEQKLMDLAAAYKMSVEKFKEMLDSKGYVESTVRRLVRQYKLKLDKKI